MSTKYSDAEIRRLVHQYHIERNLENAENPSENENYKDLAEGCSYSILENFCPDCPGWVGDVLTVIYGYVDTVETFQIEDDRLVRIETIYEAMQPRKEDIQEPEMPKVAQGAFQETLRRIGELPR